MRRSFIASVVVAFLVTTITAVSQTTAPTQVDPAWQITISQVQGAAQGRPTPNEPWVPLTAGMNIPAGWEIRVGIRSAIVVIAPGQKRFTLDRLGNHKVEPALFERASTTSPAIGAPTSTLRVNSGPPRSLQPATSQPTTTP